MINLIKEIKIALQNISLLPIFLYLTIILALILNKAFADSPKWSADLSAVTSSSLYRFDNQSRTFDEEFTVGPSYKINEQYTVGASMGVLQSRDEDHTQRTFIDDGKLFVAHSGFSLSKVFRISGAAAATVPLSEKSRRDDSLYTGLTAGPNILADLSNIGLKNLQVIYKLRGTRNFHEYTVAADGSSNKEYNLTNRIDLLYAPLQKLGLRGSFVYGNGWSYAGNQTGSFSLEQAISYNITQRMGLEIGHSNGGDVLRANGQDSNIAFINENASQIYGALSYSL